MNSHERDEAEWCRLELCRIEIILRGREPDLKEPPVVLGHLDEELLALPAQGSRYHDQQVGSLGWLGHALDHLSNHPALVAASLGVTTPRALVGMQPTNIALGTSLSQFAYKPVGRVDPPRADDVYTAGFYPHTRASQDWTLVRLTPSTRLC